MPSQSKTRRRDPLWILLAASDRQLAQMVEAGLGESSFVLQARFRKMDKPPRQFGPSDVAAYRYLPRPIIAIPSPVERPCERQPDV